MAGNDCPSWRVWSTRSFISRHELPDYEAISRFNTPVIMDGETIMWVAGVGIFINGITAWLFLKQGGDDLNIRAAFLHMLADALVSLGVVISGGLALWAGLNWLDPVISLVIAGVVIAGTWSVFTQSLHLSFDGVPHALDSQAVKKHYKVWMALNRFTTCIFGQSAPSKMPLLRTLCIKTT